jgi:radical SAM protein with 4Fe4S-binding SPASM domain
LAVSVNTQIGAQTLPDLPELLEKICEVGAKQWQIQLTVAMGNAADNDDLLLQPYRLLDLMPLLARLYDDAARRGVAMVVGNNIGYFGPYEHRWRGLGDERVHWTGCSAGQNVMGLEADGTVKGCPSLATADFAGGNVRDLRLEQIWQGSRPIHFGRLRSTDDLWGFCRSCYYADVCRGGCTWTSHSLLGLPGNNPYCHYRVLELEKKGLRERIRKVREAARTPFAVGEFEIVTERMTDGTIVATSASEPRPGGAQMTIAPSEGRESPQLMLCRACDAYVLDGTATCPHCGADIQSASRAYEQESERRAQLMAMIEHAIRPQV